MFSVIQSIFTPMLYLFFFIAAGFVMNRTGLLPDNAAAVISKIESWFVIPLMVLNNFIRYCTWESLKENYQLILYSLLMFAVTWLIALPTARRLTKEAYTQNIYRYSMLFTSYGFMGYSLITALFGDEALYYFMFYVMPTNVICYTYGVPMLIPEGESRGSVWKRLKQPALLALVCGAVLGLLGVRRIVPAFLNNVMSAASTMFGPLAMLLTGITIGSFRIKELMHDKKIFLVGFLRMIAFPVILTGILILIKADARTMMFTLVAHAVPFGLFPVIYPALYGEDIRPGAAGAVITNLASALTLPLLFAALTAVINALGIAPYTG